MAKFNLSRKAIKEINAKIEDLFDRAKTRFLGPQSQDKRLLISFSHPASLPGLYEAAAAEEGVKPNTDTLDSLIDIADSYLDAVKESAKAKTIATIRQFLSDASVNGVDTNWQTVLGGQLADLWKDVTSNVERIITSEAAHAKNVSVLDGIVKVNESQGIEDPVVYFVVVRDNALCGECKRLHLMPNGKTPRLWKLSELGHGYHKKGEESPKLGGLHPHCRCTLVTLLPGYGFDKAGLVRFVKPGHNELAKQRK